MSDKLKNSNPSIVLECADREINFNTLLDKYGPEGLYLIADKLKEIADEDVRNALDQCNK